jgi:hypothetical protein
LSPFICEIARSHELCVHLLPRQAMYTLKPVRKEEKKRRAIRLARRLFLIYADMK